MGKVNKKISSQHVVLKLSVDRSNIRERLLKHFEPTEILFAIVEITDAAMIFTESDEIIIGSQSIYWYSSRVGKYYTKSNGEFDATHDSKEYIYKIQNIEVWRTICERDTCYLELQLTDGRITKSVNIPASEIKLLAELQHYLNGIKADE
jgi:hypothetical protein